MDNRNFAILIAVRCLALVVIATLALGLAVAAGDSDGSESHIEMSSLA